MALRVAFCRYPFSHRKCRGNLRPTCGTAGQAHLSAIYLLRSPPARFRPACHGRRRDKPTSMERNRVLYATPIRAGSNEAIAVSFYSGTTGISYRIWVDW